MYVLVYHNMVNKDVYKGEKVNGPILPILTLKLVAMSKPLEPSEMGGQTEIGNLRSNT